MYINIFSEYDFIENKSMTFTMGPITKMLEKIMWKWIKKISMYNYAMHCFALNWDKSLC